MEKKMFIIKQVVTIETYTKVMAESEEDAKNRCMNLKEDVNNAIDKYNYSRFNVFDNQYDIKEYAK